MRLQKYLADAGVASRRACEELIRQGRVTVNGETAQIGCGVNPATDRIEYNGRTIKINESRVVILFYKPRGIVCTSSDPRGRKTVQAYFKELPARIYNAGRLDINSEGLLVMTNDGGIAAALTHPRYEIDKTYYAVCDGELTQDEAAWLQSGVMLSDGMTAPAKVEHIARTKTGQSSFLITIYEGRNRQVRRMLETVGHKTLLLKRERVGALSLGALTPGQWRYATRRELAWLHAIATNNQNL
jgi:pseudouridine synthase